MWKSLPLLGLIVALPLAGGAPGGDDRAAVERAVLDYAECYYEGRPENVERSVHPELAKLGFVLRGESPDWEVHPMGFDELREMARSIRDGPWKPAPGPKQVEVLDLLDRTALVKLTGSWGIDYMQLARFDDVWKTRHVLWQTAPRPAVDAEAAARLRAEDRAAVEGAVRDYLLAFYEAEPERIDRSVSRELVKYGFWRAEGEDGWRPMPMDFGQLRELAARLHAGQPVGAEAPREIVVLDLLDRIAAARLEAQWGIDTLLLAKVDGVWEITHVMWQSRAEG